jgi:ribosome-associated translation inhibitor RaiA
MSTTKRTNDDTYNPLGEYVLHMGAGFVAKERPHVLETLATLAPHLGRWSPLDVSLEVSLQDRGRREQRVTLRTTLPGLSPLVAVADHPDVTRALHDAKHELIRQLEHQKSTRAPKHNRDTIRHPGASADHRPS